MRQATLNRKTAETDIKLELRLEGQGRADVSTGVGFLDHMLTLFARHGGFDLALSCAGDTQVDDHHSTEDIGIALGTAFREAAVDLSGRGGYYGRLPIPTEKVGTFDTELVQEFMTAFAREAGCTLHLVELAGENSHHIIEGAFKALARALRTAVSMDPDFGDQIPSTKGVL